jgi:hypothetical protein
VSHLRDSVDDDVNKAYGDGWRDGRAEVEAKYAPLVKAAKALVNNARVNVEGVFAYGIFTHDWIALSTALAALEKPERTGP